MIIPISDEKTKSWAVEVPTPNHTSGRLAPGILITVTLHYLCDRLLESAMFRGVDVIM